MTTNIESDRNVIYNDTGQRSGTFDEAMSGDWWGFKIDYWNSYGVIGQGIQTRETAGYDIPIYTWDYPVTADDLKGILNEITDLDISEEDKAFLGQKNITRFWVNQASVHGLEHQMNEDFAQWNRDQTAPNQYLDRSCDQGWNKMPWMNYGEDDIMPDTNGRLAAVHHRIEP